MVPLFKKLIANGAKELPITDEKMTRFWITLEDGVKFVLKNFERMQGGELFIPKIPSMKITDLAATLAPNLPTKIIGIRPGEKLHEIMISADDALHSLEFSDHYVIMPSIKFYDKQANFAINKLGEKGYSVSSEFEYRSDNNTQWLDGKSLKEMIEKI